MNSAVYKIWKKMCNALIIITTHIVSSNPPERPLKTQACYIIEKSITR